MEQANIVGFTILRGKCLRYIALCIVSIEEVNPKICRRGNNDAMCVLKFYNKETYCAGCHYATSAPVNGYWPRAYLKARNNTKEWISRTETRWISASTGRRTAMDRSIVCATVDPTGNRLSCTRPQSGPGTGNVRETGTGTWGVLCARRSGRAGKRIADAGSDPDLGRRATARAQDPLRSRARRSVQI